MKFTIERFYIKGLHGRRSIDIPITDNRLILVGENGSGKTTIINLLYFFLSRQWARLADFNFDSISLTIDGQELKITADQLRQKGRITRSVFEHYQRRVPKFVVERIRNHLTRMSTKKYDYAMTRSAIEELAWRYGRELDVHPELIHDLALQMLEEPRQHNQFEQLETELCKMFQGQILYLPTYRRIEQDLKSIFPHLDVDRLIGRREEYRGSMDPTYTELVEFGMRDVDDQIKRKMKELQDNITNSLKSLTGSYLSDIIGGKYLQVSTSDYADLNTEAVESILARIEETVLSKKDKTRVRQMIEQLKPQTDLTDDQRIIAHFLSKLHELYAAQQEKERDTRHFIDLCNKYLTGKELKFNSDKYSVSVELTDFKQKKSSKSHKGKNNSNEIALRQLSSGEKQIVSLFSHLFLSDVNAFFVLIDEPELSLSVPWQKSFLVDIIGTQRCDGLIAVTHSPFIFDNELDHNAHAVDEFWV